MSRAGKSEATVYFVDVIEEAVDLWERGQKEAATAALRRAAVTAVEVGSLTQASELLRLAGDIDDGLAVVRGGRQSETNLWPAEEQSFIRKRPPELQGDTTPSVRNAEYPAPLQGRISVVDFNIVSPLEFEPATPPEQLPQFSTSRPRYFCRFSPRRRSAVLRASAQPEMQGTTPTMPVPGTETLSPPSERRAVVGISARGVFASLPRTGRSLLRDGARRLLLEQGQAAPDFALACVAHGRLSLQLGDGTQDLFELDTGTLVRRLPVRASPVDVRWVACTDDVGLVVWREDTVCRLLEQTDELRLTLEGVARHLDALTAASRGPLARVSESTRTDMFRRSELRTLSPGEVLVESGNKVPGLMVVGDGSVHSTGEERSWTRGALVLPFRLLDRTAVDQTLRAGEEGATVVLVERVEAVALICERPDLLELISLL